MNNKLNVEERLLLLGLLPDRGDLLTGEIIIALKKDLSFSEGEMEQLKMKQEGDHVYWDTGVHLTKEIDMGAKATSIIIDKLDGMEKQGQLPISHIPLYKRFVLPEKNNMQGKKKS
jgi:hypothetical protein